MRMWLLVARASKRLKQKEVSALCGISNATYSNIENGRYEPSVHTAKKIASVLEFDWTKFYEDE